VKRPKIVWLGMSAQNGAGANGQASMEVTVQAKGPLLQEKVALASVKLRPTVLPGCHTAVSWAFATVEGFPSTRPSLRSQMRTRRTHFQSSRRGSSITTHPRTTLSYQARRKEEEEEEEEHEGEVGDSKAEEEEVGRRTEGDLSSKGERRARVDAGSKQEKQDKKATKEEATAQVGTWRTALMPVFPFQLRPTLPVSGFAGSVASCFFNNELELLGGEQAR